MLPDPVLVKGEPGTWDDYGLFNSSVHYDGAIYHMFYSGIGGGKVQIGHATSTDGKIWVKDDEHNPVIAHGENGTFYDEWICANGLVVYNDTIRIFFDGYDGTTTSPELSYFRVGYAWSTDYVNWTVENNMEPVVDVGDPGELG